MMEIGDISTPIANCEIVASVTLNSGIRTYHNNGKYVNIHLVQADEQIKLTVFGDDVSKVVDLEVFVEIIFMHSNY